MQKRSLSNARVYQKSEVSTIVASATESGLLPWQLPNPLSRMAIYPGTSSNSLVVAGGLTANGTSTKSIYALNINNGQISKDGNLPTPVHDAASANINNNYAIFGGGNTGSVNTAQVFSDSGSIIKSGSMPQLRSDSSAVTIAGSTYIIGGYNGTSADSSILVTNDGVHFHAFASLPVPVRYTAAVAYQNNIYVFGGQAVNGTSAGQPINTVQEINVSSHIVSILPWHLPVPLEGSAAFVVQNQLYIAGGISTTIEPISLGVGTTQFPGVSVNSSSLTHNTIWAVDVNMGEFLNAGQLQVPVANAGLAVIGSRAWLIGGEYNSQVVSAVQMIIPNKKFGIAGQPGAGSPYFGGKLLIADRGNNRLLVMNPDQRITWKFPSTVTPATIQQGFYFPDDAFFANKGSEIISNQEDNNTIVRIGYPSGKILWTYGHPLQPGSAPGYLRAPDDAYLLKNDNVLVADDQNCRVLFINPAKQVVGKIGHTGVCVHNISLASPNGDTPLFNGDVLISEIIGSWVSEYTPAGKMVWTVHLPISYPSDPQQIAASATTNPNHYLIADYADPGSILQFTRQGRIIPKYQVSSGPGMLKNPSLVELLPSGVYFANDDYRNRVVAIDPATGALVWQYGVSDQPGTTYGMLHKPDGFDVLLNDGTTPTHPATK